MSESETNLAEGMEAILAGVAAPPSDPAELAQCRQQLRIDGLLEARFTEADADRVYALIRAVSSASRQQRIAGRISSLRRQRVRRRPAVVAARLVFACAAVAAVVVCAALVWIESHSAPVPLPKTVGLPPPPEQPNQARLVTLASGLEVRRGDRILTPVTDLRLEIGDVLTAARPGTVLGYPDGTRLDLRPDTRLAIAGDASGKQVRIAAGGLTAAVSPQPSGHPLTIAAERSRIEVVGTEFAFVAEPTGDRLQVIKGLVRMFGQDSASLEVAAGQQALAGIDRRLAFAAPFDTSKLIPRLVDECEDPQTWDRNDLPVSLTRDAPASGSASLRLTFRSETGAPWAALGRSLSFGPRDRAVRFALRVETAAPGAQAYVHVHDRDQASWALANWHEIPGGGWRTITIPIPPFGQPPLAGNDPRLNPWDPLRAAELFIGCSTASATICVDRFEVLAEP